MSAPAGGSGVGAVGPSGARSGVWAGAWAWGVLGLILGVLAARLAYLAWWCPYALVEDEAHYWEWSRRLDWSYYTKGPGIALAIRAGTELLGHSELAVRSVAAVSGALTALAVAWLLRMMAADRGAAEAWRVAFYGVCALHLAPALQLLGLVSTIDGPYLACWAFACVGAWAGLVCGRLWGWALLGAAVGVGFLFKYTVLMVVPGLAVFWLLGKGYGAWKLGSGERAGGRGLDAGDRAGGDLLDSRPQTPDPRPLLGVVLALVIASAGLLPVLIWNAQHDWGTVRHLLGHLGVAGGDMPSPGAGSTGAEGWNYDPVWTLEFMGTQLGMIGPVLALAAIGMRRGWRERLRPAERRGAVFLAVMGLPLLALYFGLTFVTEVEGNWPIAAYVTLAPLGGWVAAEAMREYAARVRAWRARGVGTDGLRAWEGRIRRKPETVGQVLWHVTIVYGLVAGLGMLRLDWLAAAPVVGPVVPMGRFDGAVERAEHVRELLEGLEGRQRGVGGSEAMVIAQHYGRASQMAFYLPRVGLRGGEEGGRPLVLCSSTRMNGRRTQYDLWDDTSLERGDLRGRGAVLLGGTIEQWRPWFERVEPVPATAENAAGELRGETKRGRGAFVGHRFVGLRTEEAGR